MYQNQLNTTTFLVEQLSNKGTEAYLKVVEAIVEELGIRLAFCLNPVSTSKFVANRNHFEPELYSQHIQSLFYQLGISKDLEALETDLHKTISKLFYKYRDKTEIKAFQKVTNEHV